jgi:hypothetical protein
MYNWSRDHLEGSISIDETVSVSGPQRDSIVRQIMEASPQLNHLVVEWCDLPDCSFVYSNLQSLHLILKQSTHEDRDLLDLERVAQLMLSVRRLETSGAILMPSNKLVAFILNIITRFYRMVHLMINKHGRYQSKQRVQTRFLELFIAACEERGYDGTMVDLRFYRNDEINIWL